MLSGELGRPAIIVNECIGVAICSLASQPTLKGLATHTCIVEQQHRVYTGIALQVPGALPVAVLGDMLFA